MLVNIKPNTIEVTKDEKKIIISAKHVVYIRDIVTQFDYYYNAVIHSFGIVDYSTPRLHKVAGFRTFPVMFPSFAESVQTTKQYINFAKLKEGMTVIDLGAYSGLSSILFAEIVGSTGKVIAVDADYQNYNSIRNNLAEYERYKKSNIVFIEGAVWSHNRGILFSSEQNMGASAAEIVGERGEVVEVKSYTLSDIAHGLNSVDFIKVDIEGAEAEIFKDADFFTRYRPRMIVETHGKETDKKVIDILSRYGYAVTAVQQKGVRFPLLECVPNG